jgi:hypothetical protein
MALAKAEVEKAKAGALEEHHNLFIFFILKKLKVITICGKFCCCW